MFEINQNTQQQTQAMRQTSAYDEVVARMPVTHMAPPSGVWRMLSKRGGKKKLPKGLDAWWDAAVGYAQATVPRKQIFMRRALDVLALEKQFHDMSDARLKRKAEQLHRQFRLGKDRKRHVSMAYAIVREFVYREMGFMLHHEQVAAGLAMEAGCIAELATGEGKTLCATLPATIAGWRGRGVHVMTVNDYLAARDAENMRPIYKRCGLTVAHVDGEMQGQVRQQAYQADITYCTNKEVAADFLRDKLAMGHLQDLPSALLDKLAGVSKRGLDNLLLRGLETAIIDEADSVLIDEAVTPLIISGEAPNDEQVHAFKEAADIARQLVINTEYRVDARFQDVELTRAGRERVAQLTEHLSGLWKGVRRREELIRQALTARELYREGKQYVVQEGKIVIVDEFTGRLMPDRTWRDGLHQAVEAKEGVDVNAMKGTLARISFQRFFRMYRKLSGMTGTAMENRQEMWVIYHLPIVPIPTHKPIIRKKKPDRVFKKNDDKWEYIVEEIRAIREEGRPILVGTRSVGASERLSRMLAFHNLPHEVLNAIHHEKEAQIIAEAGKLNRITVATNMAGRGTDIKPEKEVKERGGLHVILTERHESGRVDRQLYGRTGRQGDPGTVSSYAALDDELFLRYAPAWAKAILHGRVQLKRGTSSLLVRKVTDFVQWRAQRRAFGQRKSVLKSDDWLEENLGFAGREF